MKNLKKIITITLVVALLAITTLCLFGCTDSISDKLDALLKEMSQIRKEIEKQQSTIDALIGGENIQVIFVSPTQKLKNSAELRGQSLEIGYQVLTLTYSEVLESKGADAKKVTQEDVLKHLKSAGKIDYSLNPAIGLEFISVTGTDYRLEKTSANYIFNCTTVAEFCPPSLSAYDYTFKFNNVEVFSAYDTVSNTLVTKGSIMAFSAVDFSV